MPYLVDSDMIDISRGKQGTHEYVDGFTSFVLLRATLAEPPSNFLNAQA